VIGNTGTVKLVANGKRTWAYIPFPAGGYRDSFGRTDANDSRLIDRGPGEIGPDGEIVLRPFSNAFAEVIDPDGTIWPLADFDIFDIQLLGQRQAIFRAVRDPQALHSRGGVVEQPKGAWGWPRMITWPGGTFKLLYQSFDGGALVLDGHIVADGVNFFRPDAIVIGNAIYIGWSTGPQEYGVTPPPLVIPIAELSKLPLIADRLNTSHNDAPHNDAPHGDIPQEPNVSRKDELFPILQVLNTESRFALRLQGTSEATQAHSIRFLTEAVLRARRQGLTRFGLLKKPEGINADNVTSREDNGVILHFDVISGADGLAADGTLTHIPTLAWGDNGPIQSGWSQFIPDDVAHDDAPHNDVHNDAPHNDVPSPNTTLARLGKLEAEMIDVKTRLSFLEKGGPTPPPAPTTELEVLREILATEKAILAALVKALE